MKRKKKTRIRKTGRAQRLFVVIGSALCLLMCGVLYLNYQLDKVVQRLESAGTIYYLEDENSGGNGQTAAAPDEGAGSATRPENAGRSDGKASSTSPGGEEVLPDSPSKQEIINQVEKRVSRPIDKRDLLRAGIIIMRRLSAEEIGFLYRLGKKDTLSREEIRQARNILFARLNKDELETLTKIGAKYDQPVFLLDPAYPW